MEDNVVIIASPRDNKNYVVETRKSAPPAKTEVCVAEHLKVCACFLAVKNASLAVTHVFLVCEPERVTNVRQNNIFLIVAVCGVFSPPSTVPLEMGNY